MPWTRDEWKQWCTEQAQAYHDGEIQKTTVAEDMDDMENYGPGTGHADVVYMYNPNENTVDIHDYDTAKQIIEDEGGYVLDPPEAFEDNDF
jgi:hypothetical protein